MKNKTSITAGVITVGVLITGIAFAIQDAGPTGAVSLAEGQTVTLPAGEDSMVEATSTTNRTSTTGQTSGTGATPIANTATPAAGRAGTSPLADGQTNTIVVSEAGSVLLRRDGATLTIMSTEPNPGWVVEVEVAKGREVEGDFRSGGRRIKFNFELEDGVVRTDIETEGPTGSTNTTAIANTTAPSPSLTTGPTTTDTVSATNTTGGSSIPNGSVTYDLDGAGTVTVIFGDGGMTIGSIDPAAGWIVDKSEQSSNEIEVELVAGEAEVELNLHITGAQLVVQIVRT